DPEKCSIEEILDLLERHPHWFLPRSAIVAMISDRHIWRTAHAMIEQFCEDASVRATMRVDASLAEGDLDGHHVWKRLGSFLDSTRFASLPTQSERMMRPQLEYAHDCRIDN